MKKRGDTLNTQNFFYRQQIWTPTISTESVSVRKNNVHRNLSYRTKLAELLIASLTPSRVRKYKKNTTKNLTFAWTSEMGEIYAQETLTLSIVLDYLEHEDSESSIRLKKEWKLTEKTQKQSSLTGTIQEKKDLKMTKKMTIFFFFF